MEGVAKQLQLAIPPYVPISPFKPTTSTKVEQEFHKEEDSDIEDQRQNKSTVSSHISFNEIQLSDANLKRKSGNFSVAESNDLSDVIINDKIIKLDSSNDVNPKNVSHERDGTARDETDSMIQSKRTKYTDGKAC